MRILALDLGKSKTVGCVFEGQTGEHEFETALTNPDMLQLLIEHYRPARVVMEISPLAGWVSDLVRAMGLELQVANPNHEAWRWRNVKRKTDRLDALKLARLSAMNQLPLVHVPERRTRQWRGLIQHRQVLVARRTAVKNRIRAILDMQGLRVLPAGKRGWSREAMQRLHELAHPVAEVDIEDFWRGELWIELRQLEQLQALLKELEAKLDTAARADPRVALLESVPGVGPRLAEMLVATIDDPHRFRNGKQVGAYVGLTPRQYQSGSMDRLGRISGQGNRYLRSLLVEVAWLGLQHNSWMQEIYRRVNRGSRARRKVAIVAVARRLLVRCWAMLRDGTRWRRPAERLQPQVA